MTSQCACGAVTIHRDEDKLVVSAENTTAILSFTGGAELKIQHLNCGACLRAVVPT